MCDSKFELSASMVIEERYERDQEKAFSLLTRHLKNWSGKSLFKLACAGRADFVNNYCFQSYLDNISYGEITVHVPQWKLNCKVNPTLFICRVFRGTDFD